MTAILVPNIKLSFTQFTLFFAIPIQLLERTFQNREIVVPEQLWSVNTDYRFARLDEILNLDYFTFTHIIGWMESLVVSKLIEPQMIRDWLAVLKFVLADLPPTEDIRRYQQECETSLDRLSLWEDQD